MTSTPTKGHCLQLVKQVSDGRAPTQTDCSGSTQSLTPSLQCLVSTQCFFIAYLLTDCSSDLDSAAWFNYYKDYNYKLVDKSDPSGTESLISYLTG